MTAERTQCVTDLGSAAIGVDSDSILATLAPIASLDRAVFRDDALAMEEDQAAARRTEWIRDALAFHLDHCELFRIFAERVGFTIEQIQDRTDLVCVPQIPTAAFKRVRVESLSGKKVEQFTSSGTQGVVSIVNRDERTLARLLGSINCSLPLLAPYVPDTLELEDDLTIVHLGPTRSESNGVWMAYVMSLVELLAPTVHAVVDGKLDLARVRDVVESALHAGRSVAIFGAPVLIARFMHYLDAIGVRLVGGDQVVVVSGGGWKHAGGEHLERADFVAAVTTGLGLAKSDQLRDAFNQVELNTVFLECDHHRKHVPPWVEVIVRDLRTLEPLPRGREGLLSYLDPTAESFPCFIVGDDVGILDGEQCPCGVPAATVRFVRRLQRSANDGCAQKMDAITGAASGDRGDPGASWR